MKVITQSHEIFDDCPDGLYTLKKIERIGRKCYNSSDLITEDSCHGFVRGLIKSGHTSVLEHSAVTVDLTTSRQVTHELVRHRTGVAFTQESTRYCAYDKEKFGSELTFIRPVWTKEGVVEKVEDDDPRYVAWEKHMREVEQRYLYSRDVLKESAQESAKYLPNCLKANICITANLREWRHILNLRCAPRALPSTYVLMRGVLREFQDRFPVIFEDCWRPDCQKV